MGLKLITAPVVEPITLSEAKLHCKIETADLDSAVTGWIASARDQVEHRTGRCLITQTWLYTADSFKSCSIELPGSPVQQIDFVKYLDLNGTLQTVSGADYQLINDELIASVIPVYGKSWPAARNYPGSVQIQYKAGFGDAAANIPASVKSWMLLAIDTWYKNSSAVNEVQPYELPRHFCEALLDPIRIRHLS